MTVLRMTDTGCQNAPQHLADQLDEVKSPVESRHHKLTNEIQFTLNDHIHSLVFSYKFFKVGCKIQSDHVLD